MATIGGARALQMEGSAGSLEPGKRADFQVLFCGSASEATVHAAFVAKGRLEQVYVTGEKYPVT